MGDVHVHAENPDDPPRLVVDPAAEDPHPPGRSHPGVVAELQIERFAAGEGRVPFGLHPLKVVGKHRAPPVVDADHVRSVVEDQDVFTEAGLLRTGQLPFPVPDPGTGLGEPKAFLALAERGLRPFLLGDVAENDLDGGVPANMIRAPRPCTVTVVPWGGGSPTVVRGLSSPRRSAAMFHFTRSRLPGWTRSSIGRPIEVSCLSAPNMARVAGLAKTIVSSWSIRMASGPGSTRFRYFSSLSASESPRLHERGHVTRGEHDLGHASVRAGERSDRVGMGPEPSRRGSGELALDRFTRFEDPAKVAPERVELGRREPPLLRGVADQVLGGAPEVRARAALT